MFKLSLKQAFTLIELLVVIAIIGILSGLIVVSMSSVTSKANVAKAQVFSNSLRNSLMANIVSEWKMDELTTAVDNTVITDSWGGANNLTLDINSVVADSADKLRADCVSGKCIQLDGTDDYLYSSASATSLDFGNGTTDNPFTLGGWFKITDATTRAFMGKWSGVGTYQYILYTDGSDRVNLQIRDISTNGYLLKYSDTAITNYENQWIYLVSTYDGSESSTGMSIYLNGSKVSVTTSNSGTYVAMEAPGVSFRVGQYSSTAFLSGLVDDIRVFNNVLPAYQIQEQYYAGLNSLWAKGELNREEYISRINAAAYEH